MIKLNHKCDIDKPVVIIHGYIHLMNTGPPKIASSGK